MERAAFKLLAALYAFVLTCDGAKTFEDSPKTDSSYYTAGVVEFRPIISGMSSQQMLQEHLEAYMEIMRSAEANATDIIVFPEGTLNNVLQMSYVPDPLEQIVPCLLDATSPYADFLRQLSCTSRDVRKYLLINLTEKENCTSALHDPRPCAPNGLNVYNTNVVFDREGRIISRYRKWHIYVEAKNTTQQPEYAIFETDFGVRFGHFVCFDMLFYTPPEELVRLHGVHDIIFTSMFYSELPFLTAVQLQASWAWANDVNLLAAGASFPASGMTGSGIYAGAQGALNSLMVGGTGVRQLLVAKVPKNRSIVAKQKQQRLPPQTGLQLMQDYQLENYTTQLVDFVRRRDVQQSICVDDFCCQFNITTKSKQSTQSSTSAYKYRIALFNGNRRYEKLEWSSLQICGIFACTTDALESCGEIFNATTDFESNFVFTSIVIEGSFSKTDKLLLMPNSLNAALYPLEVDQVQWRIVDRGSCFTVSHATTEEVEDLLTFGIYGNYYDRSIGSAISTVTTLAVIAFCLHLILNL